MNPNPLQLPLLLLGDDADDSTIFTAPIVGGGLTDVAACDVACSCDENAHPRAISAESECSWTCPSSTTFLAVVRRAASVPLLSLLPSTRPSAATLVPKSVADCQCKISKTVSRYVLVNLLC